MSRQGSIAFKSTKDDICSEKPDAHLVWRKTTGINKNTFMYTHERPLPHDVAEEALEFITTIIKNDGFPFQLQYAMAIPLWKRFTEAWCDTGDIKASLNAI